MEAWQGHFPLYRFKRGVMGPEVPFHHWCRSRQIFRGAKDFSRISPNLPEKVFVQLLPTNFLQQRSIRSVFGLTSRTGLHVFFCKPWAPFFEIKQF